MLNTKSQIHPLGVLNPSFRAKSRSKWQDENLRTISEQNSRYSKMGSMENSYVSKQQTSRIDLKYSPIIEKQSFRNYNQQNLINPNNNSSSIVYIQNSPQKNMIPQPRVPPMHSPRHFYNNDSSCVIINNRKFESRSRSISPSSCRIGMSPQRTVIRTISRQRSQLHPKIQQSRINRFPDLEKELINQYNSQKQNLLRKIDILEKRVEEVHKEKQNSVIALLKENQILKEEIDKINKINATSMQESKYTDNLSQKMISLSELGEMDSLRQANIKMAAQIQELTLKINEYSHPFKAIEKEEERSRRVIMEPIYNKPQLILLPMIEEQGSISQIIGLHGQLSINSNPKNKSAKETDEEIQYRQLEEIMTNFSKIDEENQELKSQILAMTQQIEGKNIQLKEKNDKIQELEEYVKTVNGFLTMDAPEQANKDDKEDEIIDFNVSA